MIRSIRIRGLGPHEDTRLDLDPRGVTTIRGRSESGKSTAALDAVAFAMWGSSRTGHAIRRAQVRGNEVTVDLTLTSGTVVTRSLRWERDKEGKLTRGEPQRKVGDVEHRTEASFRQALAKMGAPDVLRLVLMPMAWRVLAESAGGGRGLRDAIARLLPEIDIRPVVAELIAPRVLRKSDPVTPADVEDLRRRAKITRDELRGSVGALRGVLEAAVADTERLAGRTTDGTAASGVVEMAETWERFRAAYRLHTAQSDQAVARLRDIDAWAARRKEIGDEPPGTVTAKDLGAAETAAAEAGHTRAAASRTLGKAERDLEVARRDLEREQETPAHPSLAFSDALNAATGRRIHLEQHGPGETCPTCSQSWTGAAEQHAAEVAAARAECETAKAALDAARKAAEAEHVERIKAMEAAVATLAKELATAQKEADGSAVALAATSATLARLRGAAEPLRAWQSQIAALGPKPDLIEVGEPPREPSHADPGEEAAVEARRQLEQAQQDRGSLAQRRSDVEQGRKALAAAEQAFVEAEAEVEHWEALVDAVRAAPSEALRRSAGAALGSLGPVELLWEGDGVEVLVDGRPWAVASDGRQVVADAWLRAGIRRAAKVPWCPLVVDRAQDVAGQRLHAPAPAIVLLTEDCPLHVVARELAGGAA